jgi:hypothetical protein
VSIQGVKGNLLLSCVVTAFKKPASHNKTLKSITFHLHAIETPTEAQPTKWPSEVPVTLNKDSYHTCDGPIPTSGEMLYVVHSTIAQHVTRANYNHYPYPYTCHPPPYYTLAHCLLPTAVLHAHPPSTAHRCTACRHAACHRTACPHTACCCTACCHTAHHHMQSCHTKLHHDTTTACLHSSHTYIPLMKALEEFLTFLIQPIGLGLGLTLPSIYPYSGYVLPLLIAVLAILLSALYSDNRSMALFQFIMWVLAWALLGFEGSKYCTIYPEYAVLM